jgi:hypothetical protein
MGRAINAATARIGAAFASPVVRPCSLSGRLNSRYNSPAAAFWSRRGANRREQIHRENEN